MPKTKVVYPELSYRIVGCLFEVYNTFGPNHREKYYQNAVAVELKNARLKFIREVPVNLVYKNNCIGKNFLDFLIEDKIILEIKVGNYFTKRNLEQLLSYLKATNLKLGIIANFARDRLKFYRVLNV